MLIDQIVRVARRVRHSDWVGQVLAQAFGLFECLTPEAFVEKYLA